MQPTTLPLTTAPTNWRPAASPPPPTTRPAPPDVFQAAPPEDEQARLFEQIRQRRLDHSSYPRQADGTIPSGVLVIHDGFGDPRQGPGHGDHVEFAARSAGFQGPVVEHQNQRESRPEAARSLEALVDVARPGQTREQVLSSIDAFSVRQEQILLGTVTEELDSAHRAGLRNGSINFSQSSAPVDVMNKIYSLAAPAWRGQPAEGRENGQRFAHNLSLAFGLDEARLLNPDPAVGGPERARLQQALLDRVVAARRDNRELQPYRQAFGDAVRRADADHVSVVVAAGNAGTLLDGLAAERGNAALRVDPAIYADALSGPASVVVVGSSLATPERQTAAPYTTPNSAIDFYTDDRIPDPASPNGVGVGTSFAAPRVAALLAQLHQDFPNLSNAEVEAMARDRLSTPLPAQGRLPAAPALDVQRTMRYLGQHQLPPPSGPAR